MALPPPLGFKGMEGPLKGHMSILVGKIICILNIPDRAGKLYFPEVMWSMFFNICGVSSKSMAKNKLLKEVLTNVKVQYPLLRNEKNYTIDRL